MPQMTIFECQKDKNMTRVKNKVINVKVILEFISTLTIVPEILIPQLYYIFCTRSLKIGISRLSPSVGNPISRTRCFLLCSRNEGEIALQGWYLMM
jgi:hypothetical protein